MSILNRLFATGETRALTRASFGLGLNSSSGAARSTAGVDVTMDSAMQLMSVQACVRLYSGIIGGLHLEPMTIKNGVRTPLSTSPRWLTYPTSEDTWASWASKVVASLLLDGNAFLLVVRDSKGNVVELIPVDPKAVSVDRDPNANWVLRYRIALPGTQQVTYYAPDILHIPNLIMPGYVRGLSPIAYARNTIGGAMALEDAQGRFWANGAHLSGVIQAPKELTPEAAQIIRQGFSEAHSGLSRAHLPAVLSGGMEWKPLSVTPEDAQFLQSRGYNASAIAGQLFGVPSHLIGETDKTSSWGTGVAEMTRGWLMMGLGPLLEKLEQSLSTLVYGNSFLAFDAEKLLRTDAVARWDMYQKQVQIGVRSVDEVRAEENLPALADGMGEARFRLANLVPLEAPGGTPMPKPVAELVSVIPGDESETIEPIMEPDPDATVTDTNTGSDEESSNA